jgi:hypothetical protein
MFPFPVQSYHKVNVGNLTNLLDAKGFLIKHALHIDDLRFELNEDSISFPWFSELPAPDEIHAYSTLIAALCKMSKLSIILATVSTLPSLIRRPTRKHKKNVSAEPQSSDEIISKHR